MREILRDYGYRTAAIVAASVALAGCTELSQSEPARPMQPCYDTPLRSEDAVFDDPNTGAKAFDASQKAYEKPIDLHFSLETKFFAEDPYIDADVEQKLKDANVLIQHDDIHASGVVTTDAHDKQIVITDAHAVANNDLNKVHITNSDGETVGVESGCYIYEDHGKRMPFTEENAEKAGILEYDIAVLRPSQPLHSAPLPVAKQTPGRGTWLTFVNNQLSNTPDYPATYSGVVVSRNPSITGDQVMTGLQPWQKKIVGEKGYTSQPGGSGGVISPIETAEIAGLMLGSNQGYESTLEDYNMSVDAPIGNETGIVPMPTYFTNATIIRKAIASPHY